MTELEKLKTVADLIRDISRGKLEIRPSIGNNVFIHASDDAYIGMEMVIKNNYPKKCVDITFRGFVRRMGTPMSGNDMEQLLEEVQQAHALVLALEIPNFQPTVEDLSAFHDYLQEQQLQSQESAEQTMQGMSM